MKNQMQVPHEVIPGHERVIDFDHLGQYTLGDKALQDELLRLFQAQLASQCVALAACHDAKVWRQAVHTLKGAARAVGAWQIADIADTLEATDIAAAADRRAGLDRLTAAKACFDEGLALLIE